MIKVAVLNSFKATPSPGPPRLMKAPVASHSLPQGGEGTEFNSHLEPLGERGRG
jgi:hypothetical protein